MKTVPIDFVIEGLEGELELREPSIALVRPFLALMGTDTQGFLLEVLNVSLFLDGKPVKNALEKIGLGVLSSLTPLVTTMLGFDKDEQSEGSGDDISGDGVELSAVPKA